jgi:probable F420-dependent oxidoreductase
MHSFRFGVSMLSVGGREEWIAKCRRAEELGYHAITVPDHLGTVSPFPAAAVAAAVTERVRVGPLVMNTPFHNPAFLARDVATTDRLSGGRLDVGLGAGNVRAEFEDAGIPFPRFADRVGHLEHTILELKRRFAAGHEPPPVQQPHPPLLIAGNGEPVLDLAAKHADILGLAGLKHAKGHPPGTLDLMSAVEVERQVALFRERAGARADDVEINMLIQHVATGPDFRERVRQWAARAGELSVSGDELMDAPQILAGPPGEVAERILQRRERYGFSYVTVFEPALEEFAPVVETLSGR